MTDVDAVDGSSTGIAMCQIVRSYEEPPMSLVGTKQPVSELSMNGCYALKSCRF